MSGRSNRDGFTLAELAVVVMIVGILAGLALPNLRQALLKADASHMVADAHTISLAAYDFLSESGRFPSTGGAGMLPAEMEGMLPEEYAFTYKGVSYMWISITLPNADNAWGSRNLGILMLNYSTCPEFATPMKAYQGGDAYWSPSLFYFIWAG